jgi:hypothetical protein
MKRKWKIAIIATVVLLLAGTLAFAQAGSSPKTGEQGAPFNLDESVWCGSPRSGFGSGGCGGPGGYNGSPDDNGGYDGGSGFSCH